MHSEKHEKQRANDATSTEARPLPKPIRGDVFKARLDPTEGSEQAGSRPVVVVTRDSINANSPVVVIVPVTDAEHVRKTYPMHVFLPKGQGGLKKDSIVKTEQIRAIQTTRFSEYYGKLDAGSVTKIEEALKIILAMR